MNANERLEDLWLAHNAAIRAYARRRVPGDLADDVVTEVFIVAARRIDEMPADALPWLFGCARRVVANQRRGILRRHKLIRRLEVWGAPDSPRTEDSMLTDALAALSARDRELLLLIAWEGLTHAQAAVALGITVNAVGVRLHRARKRLAGALEEASPAEGHVQEGSSA